MLQAIIRLSLIASIYAVCGFSQPTIDFTGGAKTSPFKRLADEPGRCTQGEYYENTVTGNLRRCTALNTWTDFPDISKINGTTVPISTAADTLLLTTAPAVAAWTAIPGCLDSAGNHLNYNTATHAFSCGTTSAGGGGTVTSVSGTANQIAVATGTTSPVLSIPSVLVFPGSYVGKQTITTFSATPAFDLSTGQSFKITLTGNVTSSTWTNLTAGERTTFLICQDATGSRTFAWPATAKGAMTIGSTLSTCNSQSFISDGTNLYAEAIGMVNM